MRSRNGEKMRSIRSHLPNMLVRRDIAGLGGGGGGGGVKNRLFEKSHPRSQFFENFSIFLLRSSIKHK